jgi:hypothetical protein
VKGLSRVGSEMDLGVGRRQRWIAQVDLIREAQVGQSAVGGRAQIEVRENRKQPQLPGAVLDEALTTSTGKFRRPKFGHHPAKRGSSWPSRLPRPANQP